MDDPFAEPLEDGMDEGAEGSDPFAEPSQSVNPFINFANPPVVAFQPITAIGSSQILLNARAGAAPAAKNASKAKRKPINRAVVAAASAAAVSRRGRQKKATDRYVHPDHDALMEREGFNVAIEDVSSIVDSECDDEYDDLNSLMDPEENRYEDDDDDDDDNNNDEEDEDNDGLPAASSSQDYQHNRTSRPVAAPERVPHSVTLGVPATAAAVVVSASEAEVAKKVQVVDLKKRGTSYYHGSMAGDDRRAKAAITTANDLEPSGSGELMPGKKRQRKNYDRVMMIDDDDNNDDDNDSEQSQGNTSRQKSNLRSVLSTLNKRRDIKPVDLAAVSNKLHLCKLCGFMDTDDEKHNVVALASAASETSGASLLAPESGTGYDSTAVEDYRYANIARIVCNNVARTNEFDCCVLAATYYHNNVYRKSGGDAPVISANEIYQHFFGRPCVMDPRFQCIKMLRKASALAEHIERGMMVKNAATGEEYVDPKQAKVFMDVCCGMQKLYTWDTKNMRFFAPELPVDTDLSNALIVPGRCLRRTSKKQRHAGFK